VGEAIRTLKELLNGRDLSNKGSRKRQVEYVTRTAEKAFTKPVMWSEV